MITSRSRMVLVLCIFVGVISCSGIADGNEQPIEATLITPNAEPTNSQQVTDDPQGSGIAEPVIPTPRTDVWPQNADCEAPCWGQLVPGHTTLDEAFVILQSDPEVWSWSVKEYPGLGEETGAIAWEAMGLSGTAIATNPADETITYISIRLDRPVKLQDVRAIYDEPTHVQFWYDSEEQVSTLTVVYADNGFALNLAPFGPHRIDKFPDDAVGGRLLFFTPRSLEGYMNVQNMLERPENLVEWVEGKGLKYYCEQAFRGDLTAIEDCPK